MAWCFEDEESAHADQILDLLESQEALVPAVWLIELGSALLAGERRRRITAAEISRQLRLLDGLPIRMAACEPCSELEELVALARTHHLSVYDAAFLSLAMREGLPLATLDGRLEKAARETAVRLL